MRVMHFTCSHKAEAENPSSRTRQNAAKKVGICKMQIHDGHVLENEKIALTNASQTWKATDRCDQSISASAVESSSRWMTTCSSGAKAAMSVGILSLVLSTAAIFVGSVDPGAIVVPAV